MKHCPRCDRNLPRSSFHKSKNRKDGLACWCMECCKEYSRTYRKTERYKSVREKWDLENKEKVREYGRRATKKWLRTEKGKEYKKNYEKSEKYKEWEREYKIKNRQTLLDYKKEYNSSIGAIKIRREYQKSQEYKDKRKKYRESTNGKHAIQVAAHRRRAKKKNLRNDLTTSQWRMILKIYDNKCAYCGSTKNIQQEHVVPISKGGETTASNIVPACKSCNLSKRSMDIAYWFMAYLPGLSIE